MVQHRLNTINDVLANPIKPFDWRMPNADVIGHPLASEFLKSNDNSKTFSGFSSIRHARNWASKHFGNSIYGNTSTREYSATATATGSGQRACVTVVKTKEWYKNQIKQYKALQIERDS